MWKEHPEEMIVGSSKGSKIGGKLTGRKNLWELHPEKMRAVNSRLPHLRWHVNPDCGYCTGTS
jgi:hypothetical protein